MRKRTPRPSEPLDAASARERALRLLARREHAARELSTKLRQRGAPPEVAAAAVEGLADRDLQSDRRYAEMLVRQRVAQGHGPMRIRGELAMAGIDREGVEAVLVAAEVDWCALAVEVQARKFKGPPVDFADRQKQSRFLAGRGFAAEQIRAALAGAGDLD